MTEKSIFISVDFIHIVKNYLQYFYQTYNPTRLSETAQIKLSISYH